MIPPTEIRYFFAAMSPSPIGTRRRSILAMLVFCFLSALFPKSAPALDQNTTDTADLLATLSRIEKTLEKDTVTIETLAEATKKTNETLAASRGFLEERQAELARIEQSLAVFGPDEKNDSPEVARQHRQLLKEKTAQEKKLVEIRLLQVKGEEVLAAIAKLREQLSTRQFFHKRMDFFQLLQHLYVMRSTWTADIITFLKQRSGVTHFTPLNYAVGGFLVLVSLLFAFWSRQLLIAKARHGQGYGRSLPASAALYLPSILPALVITIYSRLLTQNIDAYTYLAPAGFALVFFFLQLWLIRLFFCPVLDTPPLVPLPEKAAPAFRRQLRTTAFFIAILSLLIVPPADKEPGASYYYLFRLLTGTALCASLARLGWLLHQIPGLNKATFWVRAILTIVLLTAIVTELLGFHNISIYVLKSFTQTAALVAFFFLIRHLVNSLFKGLSYGGDGWPHAIRKQLGLTGNEPGTSFIWMNVLISFLLVLTLLVAVTNIWTSSWPGISLSTHYIIDGFTIVGTRIAPLRIVIGLLFFTLLWTIANWGKARLKRSLSQDPRMSRSARDAIVTLAGYTGIIVAILIGLSIAGVNFASLAVIAGALSVGIGFGLQNIVNNFISGLILLFEQPIRRGDWIVVGNTEGYVKKISVRSTVISTFDRAEVIVPNSELISSQVTNWMYSDKFGRLRIPVGVAYGSDTELVKKILEEIGTIHPQAIIDGSVPKPTAFFMGFGDSALNFELRIFLNDIDSRFRTLSEINFAIDAAFRQYNIEIPFPQRDIHIRSQGTP